MSKVRNWKIVIRTVLERKRILESCHSRNEGKAAIDHDVRIVVVTVAYLLWPLLLTYTIHQRLITFRTCFVDILSNVFKIKKSNHFQDAPAEKELTEKSIVMSSLQFIALVGNQKMLGKWLSLIYHICHEWFHEDCVVMFHWMCGNRTMSVGNVTCVTNFVRHDQN